METLSYEIIINAPKKKSGTFCGMKIHTVNGQNFLIPTLLLL
jgi:hypothetical protein